MRACVSISMLLMISISVPERRPNAHLVRFQVKLYELRCPRGEPQFATVFKTKLLPNPFQNKVKTFPPPKKVHSIILR